MTKSELPSRRQMLKAGLGASSLAMAGGDLNAASVNVKLHQLVAKSQPRRSSVLKERASDDYRTSMFRFGGRLSNPIEQLFQASTRPIHEQFDVLVVGSGYGAAITAARLAPRLSPGRRLAMLERGKEWLPGDFADTFRGIYSEARNQLFGPKKRTVVNPLGLHNVVMSDEINVWTGNGLGGGSLINAGIALVPDAEVFSALNWPTALRDRRVLDPYFLRVAAGLNLTRTPCDQTPKVRARRRAADRLYPYRGFFDLSPISVMYDERYLDEFSRNPQQMIQRPCTLCGDCITGCNVGAKNTLAMNFLPIAKSWGTEIYTQVEVRSIEKIDGMYKVDLVFFDDRDCGLTRRYTSVWSRMVVLGAGSPGSPGILLNSRNKGLCLSENLGCRWSCNGDGLGFIIRKNSCSKIGGVGANENVCEAIGPTVQTSLNYKHRPRLEDRLLIQDAAIPSAAKSLFKVVLNDQELTHSGVMLGMGHDGSAGRVELDERGVVMRWPGLKQASFRKEMWAEFQQLAEASGGEYKRLKLFGDNLVSVHPLGGCAMADDPIQGVVNSDGQVFDGAYGGYADETGRPAVHQGLYVADGSIMPSSLGCNPFMTISALAERVAEGILRNPDYFDLFTSGTELSKK